MSLDTRQYKALKKLAETFGMTVLTPTGSFDEKFVALCKGLVEYLGGTFIGAHGTYVTRKGLGLYQVAKAIGMSTHASTTMTGLLLESAQFIYDQGNDGEPIKLGTFSDRVIQYLFHGVGAGEVELLQRLSSTNFTIGEYDDQLVDDDDALLRNGPSLVMDTVDKCLVGGKAGDDPDAYGMDNTIDFSISGWVKSDDVSERWLCSANPNDVIGQGFVISFLGGDIRFMTGGIVRATSSGALFNSNEGYGFRLDWDQSTSTASLYTLDRNDYIDEAVGDLEGSFALTFTHPEGFSLFTGHTSGFESEPWKGEVAEFAISNGQSSLRYVCNQSSRNILLDCSSEGPTWDGVLELVSSEDVAWAGTTNDIHRFEQFGGSKIIDLGLESNNGYFYLKNCILEAGETLELHVKWGGGSWGSGDVWDGLYFLDTIGATSGSLDINIGLNGAGVEVTDVLGKWVTFRLGYNGDVDIDYLDGNGFVSIGNTSGTLAGIDIGEFCVGRANLDPNDPLDFGDTADLEFGWARRLGEETIETWYARDAYYSRAYPDGRMLAGITATNAVELVDCKMSYYPVKQLSGSVVLNGGFENDFDDWTDTTTDDRSASISTVDPYEGAKCLKINQNGDEGGGTVRQNIPLHAGTDYEFKVAIKVENYVSGKAVFDTDDLFDDEAQFTVNANQDWVEYSAVVNSQTFDEVRLRCFLSSTADMDAYFDIVGITPLQGGNLVENGSMEDGGNVPDEWTESPTSANVKRVNDESHSGDYSEKLSGDGSNSRVAVLRQTITIIPDTYYEMSFWAHSEDWLGGNATVDTGDKFDGTCEWNINSAHDWTEYKGQFFSGAETSFEVRLLRQLNLDGEVFIDDVVVRPLITSPVGYDETTNPAVVGNMLSNNGPALMRQKTSNSQFLFSPFWSEDGIGYDRIDAWGDAMDLKSGPLFVYPIWQKISDFCILTDLITVPSPTNLATYNYVAGLQVEAGCGAGTAPYQHMGDDEGNALGDDEGNILQ